MRLHFLAQFQRHQPHNPHFHPILFYDVPRLEARLAIVFIHDIAVDEGKVCQVREPLDILRTVIVFMIAIGGGIQAQSVEGGDHRSTHGTGVFLGRECRARLLVSRIQVDATLCRAAVVIEVFPEAFIRAAGARHAVICTVAVVGMQDAQSHRRQADGKHAQQKYGRKSFHLIILSARARSSGVSMPMP